MSLVTYYYRNGIVQFKILYMYTVSNLLVLRSVSILLLHEKEKVNLGCYSNTFCIIFSFLFVSFPSPKEILPDKEKFFLRQFRAVVRKSIVMGFK